MSMMIHRAVLRRRERERQLVEKPIEEPKKEQEKKTAPAPKRGRKTKR